MSTDVLAGVTIAGLLVFIVLIAYAAFFMDNDK